VEVGDQAIAIVKEIDAAQPTNACKHFRPGDARWGGHSIVEGTHGWVEYTIENEAARSAMIAIEFNAKDSRPLQLTLNNQLVCDDFATGTTGTWKDQKMLRWHEVGPFDFPIGTSVLRLSTDGFFPHLKQLRVTVHPPAYNAISCMLAMEAKSALEDGCDVEKLEQLNTMGFGTPRANMHALAAANGSLEVAVDLLLTSDYSMADGSDAAQM